ncbi:hypothetical protein B7463_g7008, partial [Scytalidium lignicola]
MASSKDLVPGLVYVPMALNQEVTVQEIDDWYNNEHVPIRMRLPCFENGFRYRTVDTQPSSSTAPKEYNWLALYDLNDMWPLIQEKYEGLLSPNVQSSCESHVLQKIKAFRRYFDLVSTYEAPGYAPLEQLLVNGNHEDAFKGTLIVVGIRLVGNGPEYEKEWNRWYEEDHLAPLRNVPGWRRTRRYQTSVVEDKGNSEVEYLTLNEFAMDDAIGGPEHQIAIATEHKTNVVARKWRRSYKLHYIQGKAPRDLAALYRQDTSYFVSPDGLTRTVSGTNPSIESCITVSANEVVHYRLEGSVDPSSPVIVLFTVADLLWTSWDKLVSTFISSQRHRYRLLRLKIPTRSQDADKNLRDFVKTNRLQNVLKECFEALMISKCALILGAGLGGRTAEEASGKLIKINRHEFHPPLMNMCDNGIFAIADRHNGIQNIEEAITVVPIHSQSLAEWTQNVYNRL